MSVTVCGSILRFTYLLRPCWNFRFLNRACSLLEQWRLRPTGTQQRSRPQIVQIPPYPIPSLENSILPAGNSPVPRIVPVLDAILPLSCFDQAQKFQSVCLQGLARAGPLLRGPWGHPFIDLHRSAAA